MKEKKDLINKWIAMQAVQGIDSVATLRDGDPVIRMSAVEHVLENLPEAPDINVGNMDTTTHDFIPAENERNDGHGTSSDCISRQAAKDIFTELYGISAIGSVFDKYEWKDICETTANELPPIQPKQNEMIKEIRRWINSGNRGNADYFIVDRIEEIINAYEIN